MTSAEENDSPSVIGIASLPPVPESGELPLPNGCTLFWRFEASVGGRVYVSDEVGGGVHVWDTALIDQSTLLTAIVEESRLLRLEFEHARRQPESWAKRRPEETERQAAMWREYISLHPEEIGRLLDGLVPGELRGALAQRQHGSSKDT